MKRQVIVGIFLVSTTLTFPACAAGGFAGFAQGFASGGATILNDPDNIKAERLETVQKQVAELDQLSRQTEQAKANMDSHVKNLQVALEAYNEIK